VTPLRGAAKVRCLTGSHEKVFMERQLELRSEFEASGRFWFRNAVSESALLLFDEAMTDHCKAGQRLDQFGALKAALATKNSLLAVVQRLDPNARPVRVVAFNKSESANWGVPWHQDRVIAVSKKADVAGYRNWTKKSGIWHCEPPQAVLDQMLFVRVHLDDTDQDNGAMEIALASHSKGIIPSSEAERAASQCPQEVCGAKRGDVLVLKMLTLHASKPAKVSFGRRVLRVDFSSSDLPSPLSWVKAHEDSGRQS